MLTDSHLRSNSCWFNFDPYPLQVSTGARTTLASCPSSWAHVSPATPQTSPSPRLRRRSASRPTDGPGEGEWLDGQPTSWNPKPVLVDNRILGYPLFRLKVNMHVSSHGNNLLAMLNIQVVLNIQFYVGWWKGKCTQLSELLHSSEIRLP